MNARAGTRHKLLASVTIAAVLATGFGAAYASGSLTHASQPVRVTNHWVLVGGGQPDDYVNLQYTPNQINVYAGDSVTFKTNNPTEPHTVTFGPKKMIQQLVKTFIVPVPSSNGPPTLRVTTAAVVPTKSSVVTPGKFVNSGILSGEYHGLTRKTWTAHFPMPGKYEYYCLVHGTSMHGWVVVMPRLQTKSHYVVQAGPFTKNPTVADVFLPEDLTVQQGATVTWTSFFHTVTFGTVGQIRTLRHQFVLKGTDSTGKPLYQVNPRAAFPSVQGCGTGANPCSYSGGFLNAGLLQGGPKGPATFSITFNKPGTYTYGCLVHPGMDGTIIVKASSGRG